MHENKFVKFFHESKNGGKGTLNFFSGMLEAPQPGDVDMRMTNGISSNICCLFDPAEFCHQSIQRFTNGGKILVLIPVDPGESLVQCMFQLVTDRVFFAHKRKRAGDRPGEIIHFISSFMKIS